MRAGLETWRSRPTTRDGAHSTEAREPAAHAGAASQGIQGSKVKRVRDLVRHSTLAHCTGFASSSVVSTEGARLTR